MKERRRMKSKWRICGMIKVDRWIEREYTSVCIRTCISMMERHGLEKNLESKREREREEVKNISLVTIRKNISLKLTM